jgi:hypothetical protein
MSRARSAEQASPGVLRSPPLHRSGADDRREEGEALLVGVIEGVCLFGQPAESLRIFNDALRKPLAAAGYVVGSNTGPLVLLIMGAAALDARDATLGRRRPADLARREGETANCAQANPPGVSRTRTVGGFSASQMPCATSPDNSSSRGSALP